MMILGEGCAFSYAISFRTDKMSTNYTIVKIYMYLTNYLSTYHTILHIRLELMTHLKLCFVGNA